MSTPQWPKWLRLGIKPPTYTIFKDPTLFFAEPSRESGLDSLSDADATTLINKVFNLMTNGGEVFFKSGTYGLSGGLVVPSTAGKTNLFAEDGAILKPNANMAADVLTVNASDCLLERITIDMSNTGVTGSCIVTGVASTVTRNTIRDCNLNVANGLHGIRLGVNSSVCFVYGNRVQSVAAPIGNGILVSGTDHHVFENDVGGFGGGAGISLSQCTDTSVIGNQVYTNLLGIDCYLPKELRIVGNHVGFNQHHGIWVHADTGSGWYGVTITGNVIDNNSTSPTTTYDGIRVTVTGTTITDVCIVGNVITDRQVTPTQRYGIRLDDANLTNSVIANNTLTNNVTGSLSAPTPGTNVVIGNNIGFNPQGFAATTPGVPATGVAQQNTNAYPIRVLFLTVGTVTAIIVTDPAATAKTLTTATPLEVTLDPGAKITLTYAGAAPTWVWYGT